MTDTDLATETPTTTVTPSLALRSHYIKDLSFESPRAPLSLFTTRETPNVEVNVNMAAQRLEPQAVELSFQITVRAMAENAALFLVDLTYGGILEIRNLPEENLEEAVFVGGAQALFPFARRVIADVTRDGSFPPIMLEPMDFISMYKNQKIVARQ